MKTVSVSLWVALFAVAFIGSTSNELSAATISLRPVADTTLQEAYPDYNFGDGTTLTSGGRRNGGRTRALFEFDVAGNLPANAIISSVTLSLNVVHVPSGGVASVFDLNRMLASWGEGNGSDMGGSPGLAGQATWLTRFGGSSPWASPGGDFFATASASRSIGGFGSYTFASTAAMVSDVQSWLGSPSSNFGWLLRSESELTATTIRRFGSRDDSANSPVLTIQYTVVPEPCAASLAGLGIGLMAWRRAQKSPRS